MRRYNEISEGRKRKLKTSSNSVKERRPHGIALPTRYFSSIMTRLLDRLDRVVLLDAVKESLRRIGNGDPSSFLDVYLFDLLELFFIIFIIVSSDQLAAS